MATFSQVPLHPPKTGRRVALLDGDPENFSKVLGIKFERVRDDLDYMDAAQIRTNSGVYALLGYYINAPIKGMDVYISVTSPTPSHDLEEVLEAINDVGVRCIWTDPEISASSGTEAPD